MQIRTVDSYAVANGIKCVVYGGPGVHKTRLTLTCPRPLYLSAEKGFRSLVGNNIPMGPEITTLADLVNAHNWILNSKESAAYDTIILDSISELADNILHVSKSNNKDGRKAHNEATELVVFNILNSFRDLKQKHVYFIAKERYDEDSISKIKQFKPSMPNGNLIRELPYKFDFVFRLYDHFDMTSQQTWKVLQCNADTTAVAKDRSGRLAKWEPPDLGALFAKAMQCNE